MKFSAKVSSLLISGIIALSLQVAPANSAVKCNSAPLSPKIYIVYPTPPYGDVLYVSSTISQADTGDRADTIYYSESLYNPVTNIWTPWSSLISVEQKDEDGVSGGDSLFPVPGFSREEISAYSKNSCGISPVVMSNPTGKGFGLNITVPKISYTYTGKNLKLVIGRNGISIHNILKLSEEVNQVTRILTPSICKLWSGDDLIVGNSPGTCQVEFKTEAFENFLASEPFVLTVPVYGLECAKGKKIMTMTKAAPEGKITKCPSGYKATAKNNGSGA